MKYIKIILNLAFFVPTFSLFGESGGHGDWLGGVVGGLIGVSFGLVFSGQVNGSWHDVFYPPGDDHSDDRRQNGSNADDVR